MATVGRGKFNKPPRVDGLTEAKAALASLDPAFRDILREHLAKGGDIIEREAERRVRVRKIGGGKLKRSIGKNVREDGLQVSVGSGVFYARHLELGTKKMPAKRFLFPAFKRGARYVRKEVRGIMQDLKGRARFKTRKYKPKAAE